MAQELNLISTTSETEDTDHSGRIHESQKIAPQISAPSKEILKSTPAKKGDYAQTIGSQRYLSLVCSEQRCLKWYMEDMSHNCVCVHGVRWCLTIPPPLQTALAQCYAEGPSYSMGKSPSCRFSAFIIALQPTGFCILSLPGSSSHQFQSLGLLLSLASPICNSRLKEEWGRTYIDSKALLLGLNRQFKFNACWINYGLKTMQKHPRNKEKGERVSGKNGLKNPPMSETYITLYIYKHIYIRYIYTNIYSIYYIETILKGNKLYFTLC